jgi:hypothetical protein
MVPDVRINPLPEDAFPIFNGALCDWFASSLPKMCQPTLRLLAERGRFATLLLNDFVEKVNAIGTTCSDNLSGSPNPL